MRLAETNYDNAETGCCARLDPAQWDGRLFEWNDKRFLKDHVRALFHVPINMATVLTKTFEGPYRDMGKWSRSMDAFVAAKGYVTKGHLFYYATCPSCAKHFGKNHVVIFAELVAH
jgi:hypothetical protein